MPRPFRFHRLKLRFYWNDSLATCLVLLISDHWLRITIGIASCFLTLLHQAKMPERYGVEKTRFDVILHHKTFSGMFNLFAAFVLASYLKLHCIDAEISRIGGGKWMVYPQLIDKKGFTQISLIARIFYFSQKPQNNTEKRLNKCEFLIPNVFISAFFYSKLFIADL